MRSNKQKIYVINFKDKTKQIIYKKKTRWWQEKEMKLRFCKKPI